MKGGIPRTTILLGTVSGMATVLFLLCMVTGKDGGSLPTLTAVNQELGQHDRWIRFRLSSAKSRGLLTYGSTSFVVDGSPVSWGIRGKDGLDPTSGLQVPAGGAATFTAAAPRTASNTCLQLRLQVVEEDSVILKRWASRVRLAVRHRMPSLLRGPAYSSPTIVMSQAIPGFGGEPTAPPLCRPRKAPCQLGGPGRGPSSVSFVFSVIP